MFGLFKSKNDDEKQSRTQKDYVALGKQIQAVYEAVNPDRKAVYRTAFIKGIFTGVGTVIGATVVIAFLVWILSLFSEVPLVGGFMESLQRAIQDK